MLLETVLKEYLYDCQLRKLSERTIKSFRTFFKYCEEEGYIRETPMQRVKFQNEAVTVIRTFNDDDIKKMVAFYTGKHFLQRKNTLDDDDVQNIYHNWDVQSLTV